MTAKLLEKMFSKTILLRPTSEGVLEPMDITGHDGTFFNQKDGTDNQQAIETIPTRIYQVRGLKGVKKIAIQGYGTTQLLDLYESKNNTGIMSEKTFADALDINYIKGLKDGGQGGEINASLKRTLQIIMILSGMAALVGILIYLKK